MRRPRRTRRSKTRISKGGSFPFVGKTFDIDTGGQHYAHNVQPRCFSNSSNQVGGRRTRRYAGGGWSLWGDDRFGLSALNRFSNQSMNFLRMTQGKELLPIGVPWRQEKY